MEDAIPSMDDDAVRPGEDLALLSVWYHHFRNSRRCGEFHSERQCSGLWSSERRHHPLGGSHQKWGGPSTWSVSLKLRDTAAPSPRVTLDAFAESWQAEIVRAKYDVTRTTGRFTAYCFLFQQVCAKAVIIVPETATARVVYLVHGPINGLRTPHETGMRYL